MTENALTANGGDTRIRTLAWHLLWGTIGLSEPDTSELMAWPQSTIGVDTSCPAQSPSGTMEPLLLELGHWCRDLFGLIPVILCRLSPDGAFLFVNDAISKVTGHQPKELLGKNWRDVFPCSDQCGDANDLRLLLSSGDVTDCEMTLLARDRSVRTVSWSFYKRLGPDGTLESVIALGLDITDLKRLEQALQQSEESIKGVFEQAHSLVTLARDAVQEARDVIASLRPPALDALGLVEMLRSQLADIQARTALQIDFYAEQMRLPKEIETALYRVIREAVDNIVKHAHARRVVIRISRERGNVVISIQDDGVGFDTSILEHQPCQRISGLMRARNHIELLGGTFTIESKPGEGMRLGVDVPVPIPGDNRVIHEGGLHQTYFPKRL